MTAHDQMRAMLDQLMGTGRNGNFKIFLLSSSKLIDSKKKSQKMRL